MRRTGSVSIVITCALAGAFAAAAPPAYPAAPITVPPTVNATTWSQVSVPSSAPGTFNALEGVSCTSSTFCMATGQTGAPNGSLIEEWNGTSWSVVANPPLVGGTRPAQRLVRGPVLLRRGGDARARDPR